MKRFTLLLALFVFFVFKHSYAQHPHAKCNHKIAFERSLISDSLDAMSYEIHLTEVNTSNQTIAAHTKVLLVSKVENLTQITLELLDLTVDEVKINGTTGSFTQQNPFLYIPLAEPLNIGEQVEVEVFYHGSPFHENWGGFHWDGEYAFNLGVGFISEPHNLGKAWFPCIDDFHDRAFYEIYTTTENPKMAVCGGTLVEVIDNGNGTSTYHWKLNSDIPTYLASVAVGNYENVSYSFSSVSGNEIPIQIYVKPSDTTNAVGSFETLIPVLNAFEDYFGPYEWERVGYVGTQKGAMEHATNIAYPHFCINGSLAYESLMAHELSHHYFGDLVTCESAEDMWLNEGWAVFCEAIYREALYGAESYHENMFTRHKDVLQTCHIDDGGYLAVYGIPTEQTYGSTVYQKGALMVHTLRNYMGDELFFPAVKAYLQEYKFNYASSWELRDFLGNHSGMDLTDFFDAWIFTPGFPEYSIDSFNVVPNGNNFDVTVYARQKHKGPGELGNSVRVEVTFMDENWQQDTQLMEFSGEFGSQMFTIPIHPVLAMMDISDKVADATTDQTLIVSEPFSQNFPKLYCKLIADEFPEGDSAFIRVTHRWVAPDAMKNPINGLTLSNYRHWRIEALMPEEVQLNGYFVYSRYGYLDDSLMADLNDSIGMLYRANPAGEWQEVYAEKIGSQNEGIFAMPEILPGEYTLAAWDDLYVGVEDEEKPVASGEISLFPNPAGETVNIILGKRNATLVKIINNAGNVVDEIHNEQGLNSLHYNTEKLNTGTYIFMFLDHSGIEIESKKLIIN